MIEHLTAAELETITDLASTAEFARIPLMLIGANARRIAFDIPFGFQSPRTTRDWDFAVPMPNWETYAHLYRHATESHDVRFRPGESPHRLIHLNTGIFVDLVPFGTVAGPDKQLHWPQTQQTMSVLGFDEAFEFCIQETLPNAKTVRVVTPALLAALKIIAFSERSRLFTRDLLDLWFIMERYARPPAHEQRVFDELASRFPNPTYFEHLDSSLLGWDIGRQCRPPTLTAMDPVLLELSNSDSLHLESLISRSGDSEEQQAQREKIAGEFGWLRKGIAMGHAARMQSPA